MPSNPHRQQRGGNNVAPNSRDSLRMDVNHHRPFRLTLDPVLPNMPASFRGNGRWANPEN
jgi:hypothetical protein